MLWLNFFGNFFFITKFLNIASSFRYKTYWYSKSRTTCDWLPCLVDASGRSRVVRGNFGLFWLVPGDAGCFKNEFHVVPKSRKCIFRLYRRYLRIGCSELFRGHHECPGLFSWFWLFWFVYIKYWLFRTFSRRSRNQTLFWVLAILFCIIYSIPGFSVAILFSGFIPILSVYHQLVCFELL